MSEKGKMTVYLDEEKSEFLVLQRGIEATKAIVQTNLGGEPIRVTDLDRAINPAGKSTKWEIPGLGDEMEQVGEITGVVICQQPYRIYWKGEYKGGGSPPDCVSLDTIHGQGVPGGECGKCPFNEWGSGKTPNSKACSFRRRVFVLRPTEMLPMQLTLSPINAGALKTYGLRLMNKRQLQLQHVITRVSLTTATSKNGFDYAKTTFALVDVLAPDVAAQMDAYRHFLEPQLLGLAILDEPAQQPEEDVPF
jgi:hypothetical protein